MPEGYDAANIDVSTVLLNEIIPADDSPQEIGDEDENGIPDLMVGFKTAEVQAILEVGEVEHLFDTGELIDGTSFGGYDAIRMIMGELGEQSSCEF